MAKTHDYIEEVGRIVADLESLGLEPVLVGGMALVILGSRRVTRDFDFLVSIHNIKKEELTAVFYKRGLELASRTNKQGDIVATIDNPKIAAVRLELDAPASAHFFNRRTGLQIDLLFDFPIPAREVAGRSRRQKVKSFSLRIASPEDLRRLKEIAHTDRASAVDASDLEFLKGLRR